MKRTFLLLTLVFFYGQSEAQVEKEIIDQNQFWISTNNVFRYSNKMGALADFHFRKTDFVKDPNFYFMRFGLRYWALPKVTLSGGYAHMWLAFKAEDDFGFLDENRTYQEIMFKNQIQSTGTLFRIRTEQRWRETLDANRLPSGEFIFNHRFRILFSASIPLSKKSERPWHILFADEVLINFGERIVYNTFDQNRLTLGVKKRLNKNLSFDFGYMMVYQQLFNGYTYNLNHTLRLFFYGIFDFRKNVAPDSILMEDHAEE